MKKVIILGAGGNIARHVIDIIAESDDIQLTLFLRNAKQLRTMRYSRENLGINKPDC